MKDIIGLMAYSLYLRLLAISLLVPEDCEVCSMFNNERKLGIVPGDGRTGLKVGVLTHHPS